MRITNIKGRPVVDPTTARKLGIVVDVLVDTTTARLGGLDVASAEAESPTHIPAERIACIGRAAVMLRKGPPLENPTEEGTATDWLGCGSLVGLEVLDDNGDRTGYLQNAQVDPSNLMVGAYELRGAVWRRWLGWRSQIRPDEVTACSTELMLVKAGRETGPDGGGGSPITAKLA
jgi:uncharacterized protein YrrD